MAKTRETTPTVELARVNPSISTLQTGRNISKGRVSVPVGVGVGVSVGVGVDVNVGVGLAVEVGVTVVVAVGV